MRNSDSLSPTLVIVVPLYSYADDSDWMLTASDVSDVFDAEQITIGMS